MDTKTIYLDRYLCLQKSVNYLGISKYIGVTQITNLSKAKVRSYVKGIKDMLKKHEILTLDLDTEVYSRNLNIFGSCIVDFLKFDNLTVLCHTKDLYRRLTLFKRINDYTYDLILVKKELPQHKVSVDTLKGVTVKNGLASLRLKDRVSQITSIQTVNSLIKEFENSVGMDVLEIDIDGVNIWDTSKFYTAFLGSFGDRFNIKTTNTNLSKEFSMAKAYYFKKQNNIRLLLKDFLLEIELDTVLLLYTYKLGRRDMYKRRGNGEIESVKIAIFRGVNQAGEIILDTYCKEDLENKNVNTRVENISMKYLGYRDIYLGSTYHLELPLVESIADISNFNINGDTMVCAEYLDNLLSMNGIKYNKTALHSCLEISYTNLQELLNVPS